MDKEYPDTLYHYTSMSGFCGIIGSRTMWFSGIRHQAKDPAEFVCGIRFAMMVTHEKRSGYTGDDGIFLGKVQQRLKQYSESLEAGDVKIFVCSFSVHRDNERLWRDHGDNATGTCLVFDGSKISSIFSPKDYFGQCIYQKSTMRSRIIELLDDNRDSFRCRLASMDAPSAANTQAVEFKFAVIQKVAPFLKFGDYEEEGEWRLVFDETVGEVTYNGDPLHTHSLRGNPPQHPTAEIPLNDVNRNFPLREVIIGKHSPLSEDSVKECLRVHNINIDAHSVWRSNVSCHS